MNLPRLIRTVRHLEGRQVYGRLWFYLHRPRPRMGPSPSLRERAAPWTSPVVRQVSMLAEKRVRFLNCEVDISDRSVWNDSRRDKLWLYNLHYFDDLNAENPAARVFWHRTLLNRWIEENPPGHGNGWEPYPTALRIVNWIKWSLGGVRLESQWIDSLAVQLRWLEDRIEWHLLGNHLLANAKALVFGGMWFEGQEAERWLAKGLAILKRELPKQILADAGHFERSPMYHAVVLEDVLDLINICTATGFGDSIVRNWRVMAGRMRMWLATMIHPDGQIAFFNDAAFGISASYVTLEAYASRLGLPDTPPPSGILIALESSGYVRSALDGAVLFSDVAPIGPDCLPGHAHADTLSFELSLLGERVIVNGGTSIYGKSPQRQHERATRAHSTVEIDRENSSEVWGGFRVGRRARVSNISTRENGDLIEIAASHDGYRWRPGAPIHRRSWRLEPRRLSIRDCIAGGARRAIAHFHFHPHVRVEPAGLREGLLTLANGGSVNWRSSAAADLRPSQYHPEFGTTCMTNELAVEFDSDCIEVAFLW